MSKKGVEPSRHKPHEPESCASTNFATSTNSIDFLLSVNFVCASTPLTKRDI